MKYTALLYFQLLLLTALTLTQCSRRQNGIIGSTDSTSAQKTTAAQTKFYPYQTWNDTNGNVINAHSAVILYGVLLLNGYYWRIHF